MYTPLFWVLLLVVVIITSSIAVMLGYVRPVTPALIGATAGAIYASLLETHAHFGTYILTPGVNTLWGIAEPTFYNMSTSFVVIGLSFVGLVGFVNLLVSWYNEEPLSFWR